MMATRSFSPVVIVVVVLVFVVCSAIWRVGPGRAFANLGRFVLRAVSGNRPEVAEQASEGKAMGVGAATLFAVLVIFVILASRAH
jgi:hypothetical protein